MVLQASEETKRLPTHRDAVAAEDGDLAEVWEAIEHVLHRSARPRERATCLEQEIVGRADHAEIDDLELGAAGADEAETCRISSVRARLPHPSP